MKVMIVEDDEDINEMISTLVAMAGHEPMRFLCGAGVVEAVKNNPPNIILLDVLLGDMDGRDICKALKSRESTKNIPVIIVSATHNASTAHEKNCGANAYIPKPFHINDLLTTVDYYLKPGA